MKKYFQSAIHYGAPSGMIDRQNGIIHGVTIARQGLARGHGAFIDKTALLQIVDLAAARTAGIKARFGHPNMCNTALGTYLGRFHNYTFCGDAVRADLHLDPSAKETPNGNLFDYVLNLAETNPDMFGASIVFENDKFHVESFTDETGNEQEKRFFRIKELRATDIVDEPAATDGLFSADSLPALANQFLDENPEFTEFLFSKPESLIEFLIKYLDTMNLPEAIKSKFHQLFNPQTAGVAGADFKSVPQSAADFQSVPPTEAPQVAGADFQSVPPTEPAQISLSQKEYLEQLHAFNALSTKLDKALAEIESLKGQLNVRQTLPRHVADPAIEIPLEEPDKDQTGKGLIQSMPHDLKFKLRNTKT